MTSFVYDWRNRRADSDGEVDYFQRVAYDNLDRVVKSERYNTTSSSHLIARSETKYDDRGRVYQTVRYGVNPATGRVGQSLTDNTWYDASGNVIKQQPAGARLFTKQVYDGLGRKTKSLSGYDLAESSYADAGTVAGDTIVEQTEVTYDAASNVMQTTVKQRYHNATGTGEWPGRRAYSPRRASRTRRRGPIRSVASSSRTTISARLPTTIRRTRAP